MESSKLYDLDTVKEFVGDDEEQIIGLIMIFFEDVPDMVNKLFDGYEENDYEQIQFYAHKLKSSIDLFKITELQEEIRSLETNAKEKINIGNIPDQLSFIGDTLNDTISQIKQDFQL
ncbi:Hpt domain-containing protein [Bacteroidota bacterium]